MRKLFFIGFFFLFLLSIFFISKIISKTYDIQETKKNFNTLQKNLNSLLAYKIELTEENLKLSSLEVQKINELKQHWLNSLGEFSYSKTPIECYLNLQRDLNYLKNCLKSANIAINSETYYGFKIYLSTGRFPAQEDIWQLDLQSLMIKFLISTLIESQVKAIIDVKRENLKNEKELDDELFPNSNHQQLSISNIFSSKMFKISFTGNTQTLRLFINKIEAMESPFFIRDVQVGRKSQFKNALIDETEETIFSVIVEGLTLNDVIL